MVANLRMNDLNSFVMNVVSHNFLASRTRQQNRVVERKNRTFIEMARSMLHECGLLKYFWVEAGSTACYVVNYVTVCSALRKTPHEL
ncbi:Retrovirus-related Pol polyprotein from transposon TNT 1-94 [Apostasia shenzhenica]|uniref:Retrovirus-related Pol polyprotein from transposon TNT 1-94 n=1 Tax=Apostasia shenzhenica TaxID=1088818 RepID=A0A2I0APH1_9ASPA|nr:Retrovirus-related Pol polyprotein from transposon TNT 1-94 [Apostasia shenzhenica]